MSALLVIGAPTCGTSSSATIPTVLLAAGPVLRTSIKREADE
jgi:hypothetical protein